MSPKPDLSPNPWGQPGSCMKDKQIWTQLDCISVLSKKIKNKKKKSLTLFERNHHLKKKKKTALTACVRKEHQWAITTVGG